MTTYQSVSKFSLANLLITVVRDETTLQLDYPESRDELWGALNPGDLSALLALDRVVSVEVVGEEGAARFTNV